MSFLLGLLITVIIFKIIIGSIKAVIDFSCFVLDAFFYITFALLSLPFII